MSKQAELVVKLMSYGVPEEVQDVIGDQLQKYEDDEKKEEIASKILDIIDGPGDTSDIIDRIKSI